MEKVKYHIRKNGEIGECKATVKACPIGGEHFDSLQDAEKFIEKEAINDPSLSSKILPSISKDAPIKDYTSIKKLVENKRNEITPNESDAVKLYDKIQKDLSYAGLSQDEQEKVTRAMNMAWNLHAGQTRKAQDNAYIEHPLSNLSKIMSYGIKDSDILSAAALHDVVEDCTENYSKITGGKPNREKLIDHITQSFGKNTSDVVVAVSNEETKTAGMSTEEKNKAYVDHVGKQINSSQGAMLVKFSDYLDNAGTLKDAQFSDPNRKLKLAKKYQPLAKVFGDAAMHHREKNNYAFTEENHQKFIHETEKINGELSEIIGNESN